MSSSDKTASTEEVNIETAKTENDFFGEFGNEDYTASAQAGESNIMIFTVKSKISENKSDEWGIKGYYSEESSLVNYTGAVRYEITHNRTGAKKAARRFMTTAQAESFLTALINSPGGTALVS